MGLRLHIGCGNDIRPGYINIDEMNPRADVRKRIQDLDYPSEAVERIEGFMVLEHLSPDDAKEFAKNAYRMLEPGGTLVLECPDLVKVCRLVVLFRDDPDQIERGPFGLRGIFGEPTPHMTVADYHKWGYVPASATALLASAGFEQIAVSDGISHFYPLRDLRIEAVK